MLLVNLPHCMQKATLPLPVLVRLQVVPGRSGDFLLPAFRALIIEREVVSL